MKPRATQRGRIVVRGCSFSGDPVAEKGCWTPENAIRRVCSRFIRHRSNHQQPFARDIGNLVAHEVRIECDRTASTGHPLPTPNSRIQELETTLI
ncbi:MAG: hypothetical protein PVH41_00980 [Anaerolineae bacterium]